MAELNVQFVRPDRALYEGPATSLGLVVVSGGYAEIDHDQVIILADHARRTDDIDVETVRRTRDEAIETLDACEEGDHRRAYYENKINWCNLLLKQTIKDQ